ncbi:MAG: glycine C-acetyltransferase, partial [Bacteroidota bacterium]
MYGKIKEHLTTELNTIKEGGIFKRERIITSPQGARVTVQSGDDVVIMCANNYLGLSSHP